TNLPDATNFSLTIANAQPNNEGNYRVVVSNLGGSVTSVVATLTIVYPPSITNQPQSQIVAAGTNVSFSVLAGGTQPLKYQWRFKRKRESAEPDDDEQQNGYGEFLLNGCGDFNSGTGKRRQSTRQAVLRGGRAGDANSDSSEMVRIHALGRWADDKSANDHHW